ncbi:MAG: T9SS type A sorting domain-containing protein, partial [Chryseotalea sp.]
CNVNTNKGSLAITVSNNVQQYGEFTFGFVSGPMPVTWLDFNASLKNNKVELFWATATETNTSHFDVQKSLDGLIWLTIAQAEAAGFSTDQQNYYVDDYTINSGCYYRILQTDLNGAYSYSRVVKLNADEEQYFITPNPFYITQHDCIRVSPGIQKVLIFDVSGKSILIQTVDNANEIYLQNELPNGIYTVRLYNEENLLAKTVRLLVAD